MLLQILPDVAAVQGWLQIIASGGFALLAWYLIAYQMPARDKTFTEAADKQASAFSSALDTCRKTFEDTMREQRISCKEEMAGIAAQYERHMDRLFSRGKVQ